MSTNSKFYKYKQRRNHNAANLFAIFLMAYYLWNVNEFDIYFLIIVTLAIFWAGYEWYKWFKVRKTKHITKVTPFAMILPNMMVEKTHNPSFWVIILIAPLILMMGLIFYGERGLLISIPFAFFLIIGAIIAERYPIN